MHHPLESLAYVYILHPMSYNYVPALSTIGRGSPGAAFHGLGASFMCLPSNNKCARLPVVCSRPAQGPGHRASSPPYSAVARFATESLGGELLVTALNSVPHASHISSLAWSRISVTSPLRPRGLGGLAPAPAVAGELLYLPSVPRRCG